MKTHLCLESGLIEHRGHTAAYSVPLVHVCNVVLTVFKGNAFPFQWKLSRIKGLKRNFSIPKFF